MSALDWVNWYELLSRAVTSIRHTWPVEKLVLMAEEGNETPVSGDELAEQKYLSERIGL